MNNEPRYKKPNIKYTHISAILRTTCDVCGKPRNQHTTKQADICSKIRQERGFL